mmetsp:Transcript_13787/g.24629  ORF Transcript_13787/g.24629 Transcript_13787/m.24629 type:complete len:744 (-) Transcript_13787:1332-3563(-)
MIWPADHLDEVYHNICKQALGGSSCVLVYVALDCDSLCSLRILTSLLRSDDVSYKIKPVRFRNDIVTDFRQLSEAEEIHSLVLINCGGDIDLHKELSLGPSMLVYVLDSHRPFHHVNVLPSSDQVIILGDEYLSGKELVDAAENLAEFNDEDIFAMIEAQSDDEEDLDSDGEAIEDNKDARGSDEEDFSAENEEEKEDEDLDEDQDRGSIDDEDENELSDFEGGAPKALTNNERPEEEHQAPESPQQGSNPQEEGNTDKPSLDFSAEEQTAIAEEIAASNGQKRKRTRSHNSMNDKVAKASKRLCAQQYYRGLFWGTPVAHVAFTLAQQLSKDSKLFLWLAIVGTTFHYTHEHMEQDDYHTLLVSYQELVKDRAVTTSRFSSDDNIAVPVVDKDKIEFSEEYQLMLYRHWSLQDAFYYSDYVCTKLGTWRNDGDAVLHRFFAKMGISLKESQQKYSFMSMKLKRALHEKIDAYGSQFQLEDDFIFGSFEYRAGYNHQLSAADVGYCVSALLDGFSAAPTTVAARVRLQQARQQRDLDLHVSGEGSDNEEDDAERDSSEESAEMPWQESFNNAYDFLDFSVCDKNRMLFDNGLELAKAVQRAIVEEAANVLTDQKVSSAGDFRYCVLENLPPKLVSIFAQPQILMHFARFTMRAQTAANRWVGASAKPLVVGLRSAPTGSIHFVGIPAAEPGHVSRNLFSRYFAKAATIVGATCRHSCFDPACVEVELEDSQRYLLALHEAVSE